VRVRGETVTRLVGWQRIELKPGERRTVNIAIDPRLLASYNPELPGWEIAKGTVALVVGEHAGDVKAEQTLALSARRLKP
jgi:beta-glucosidase